MKTYNSILIFFIFSIMTLSFSSELFAKSTAYLSVGEANVKKSNIAIPYLRVMPGSQNDSQNISKKIRDKIVDDIEFTGLFNLMSPAAFLEDFKTAGLTIDAFKISQWTTLNAEYLLKMGLTISGTSATVDAYLYEVFGSKQIFGKRYIGQVNDPRTLANTIAGELYTALTGLPSIFKTKIAYVSDKTSNKELWIMDFDGQNKRQITKHKGTVVSPAWSPDGTKILYSVYTHRNKIKNLDLFVYDFRTGASKVLVNRKTHNTGGSWSPDGKTIALSMDIQGRFKIFLLDPDTMKLTKLTDNNSTLSVEVEPTWSPDGKRMAYNTDLPGKPMIYLINKDGTGNQRVTYAGSQNTAPSWSPTNSKITFAGMIDRTFDIFIMNPDGTNIERLTKKQGMNEDPSFAPDGNFISYSSDRAGQKNIYITNINATTDRRISFNMGNCSEPAWSPALQ